MKRYYHFLICGMIWLVSACSPKVTSNVIRNIQPKQSIDDVVVLNEKQVLPVDAEWFGSISVEGKANYNEMEQLTRFNAWKSGADYVKIKSYSTLGARSDIYAMNSDLYRIDTLSSIIPDFVSINNHLTSDDLSLTANKKIDSPFYLLASGLADYSIVNDSELKSFLFAFGAGYYFKPRFSFEIGGIISSSSALVSKSDVKVISKGLAANLSCHLKLKGNLTYIPELEFDYMNYSIESSSFDYVVLSLAPLAFEFRADDSMWGFQAGIGNFGVAYPVGNTGSVNNPLYVISFNQISLGIVRHF